MNDMWDYTVSWADVAPVLGLYALTLSAVGVYLYRRLKRTSRTYPFVFFDVVVLPKSE